MVQTHTFAVQAGTSQAAHMYTPAIVCHNMDTISRHSVSQSPQNQILLISGEHLRTWIPCRVHYIYLEERTKYCTVSHQACVERISAHSVYLSGSFRVS